MPVSLPTQLAQSKVHLSIALQVDIDTTKINIYRTEAQCTDSDGDNLCDSYENLFVIRTSHGVFIVDIDGDGRMNSIDIDTDGDAFLMPRKALRRH